YDAYVAAYGPINRYTPQIRLRRTPEGQALREQMLADGRARLTGGSVEVTDAGKAWILADITGLDEAVILIKARPRQGGFRDDPFAARVQALEKYDPEAGTASKRDIMLRRVLLSRPVVDRAAGPEDALAICMDRHAQVRLEVIAGLLGLPSADEARAALGGLVYHDPDEDCLVPAAAYLSGNVRKEPRLAR